ncbi:hypothetical protein HY570_01970 [Candidatus Micrarchaeota archaeon]|nr:hypothetical protein [Candidatus Micrarchaeota archaeon]
MIRPVGRDPNQSQPDRFAVLVRQITSKVRDFRGNRVEGSEAEVRAKIAKLAQDENVSELAAAEAMNKAAIKFGTTVPIGQLIILFMWAQKILRENGRAKINVDPLPEDRFG